ncbi:DUF1830 domain-containing protein [Crocosphaera chwakensis]|uniref:Uncharacterized protein n=1 Tax=Crocosphaera chwakensis CCY0110 TaxID=391612 RepID=A3ITD5_9CHRO|nr:DUF1830 domain-containing protein [Crocosphaera chwakensis]EAZ90220.1 hypothetical protein CY0110_04393 [Crocosphaera chwakensis CCY0110]
MCQTIVNEKKIKSIYVNDTDRMVILKIDRGQWREKVVYPRDNCIFYAHEDAYLEIYSYEFTSMILSDRIPVKQLILVDGVASSKENPELVVV